MSRPTVDAVLQALRVAGLPGEQDAAERMVDSGALDTFLDDHECTCDPGPQYDGPDPACDVHGQPSAAYSRGRVDMRDELTGAMGADNLDADADVPAWVPCDTSARGDDCGLHAAHRWHGSIREGRCDPPTEVRRVHRAQPLSVEPCRIGSDGTCRTASHYELRA